jgi:hypothetical protein
LAERTARWELQDLAGEQLGLGQQLPVGDEFRDQVAAQGPLGVDRLGGQHELHGDAGTADVDEAGDPAIAVMEAAAGTSPNELPPPGRLRVESRRKEIG